MIKTGFVSIHGKEYAVAVVNGIPYIEGKTVDEFMNTMPRDMLVDFAKVGIGEIAGKPQDIQTELDLLYIDTREG